MRLCLWLLAFLGVAAMTACGASSPSSAAAGANALDGAAADAGAGADHAHGGKDGGATGGFDGGADGGAAAAGDGGSSSGTDGGTTSGAYVLHETFNAMATGLVPTAPWSTEATNGGSVLVAEAPFAGDRSVTVTKPASTGESALSATFPAQHGRVVFEAKVLARETAGFKAIPYIYDAAGNAVASVSFQDGNIQTHVGATITTVQSFLAGEWYRVRVVVDTDDGTFDLYIDGVRAAAKQALRTASASVQMLTYYVDGDGAGTLLVDNVKVYTEAAFIGAPPAPVFDARS